MKELFESDSFFLFNLQLNLIIKNGTITFKRNKKTIRRK